MSTLAYNGGAVIAMKGKNCVAIATDRRFGIQAETIKCNFQKIFDIRPHLYVSLSDLAIGAHAYMKFMRFNCNLYEVKEHRKVPPEIFAQKISRLMSDGLFGPHPYVAPVVAGLDPDTFEPFIKNMEYGTWGSRNMDEHFVVNGTCTEQLYDMCESLYKPNLEPEELSETVHQALVNAFDRDAVSGGDIAVYIVEKDKVRKWTFLDTNALNKQFSCTSISAAKVL